MNSASLMKTWIVISLIGTISASAKPPMRDVVTDSELSLQQRKAVQQDPLQKFAATKTADPGRGGDAGKQNTTASGNSAPSVSLLAQSDIICYNGVATFVPKRAIIQIPKNLSDRMVYQPGAKLMRWAEFYELNRAWITTVEVSESQAEGNSPLAEDTQKKMVKSGALMIATYKGGPISVLPLKAPPEETQTPTPKPKS